MNNLKILLKNFSKFDRLEDISLIFELINQRLC
jgi:hypothetical protein